MGADDGRQAAAQTLIADLVVTTGKYRIEVNGSTCVSLLGETLKALESMV